MFEVKANKIADQAEFKKPGDYKILGDMGSDRYWFLFVCPCGVCQGHDSIVITEDEKATKKGSHIWHWNGSKTAPTLKPSINNTGCGWHGFLTNGVFKKVNG